MNESIVFNAEDKEIVEKLEQYRKQKDISLKEAVIELCQIALEFLNDNSRTQWENF